MLHWRSLHNIGSSRGKGDDQDLDGQTNAGAGWSIQADGSGYREGCCSSDGLLPDGAAGESRNIMAGCSGRSTQMRNLWIRSTQALSRALESGEQETALGDLAELGMSDRQAFRGMLGLVLRRQLGFWKDWEPWFALVAIVVAVCPLLATQSMGLNFFPHLVMWFHHGIAYRTGVSSAALWAEVCFRVFALITWSFTSAVALGALSRKTIWANGVLFFLLCA